MSQDEAYAAAMAQPLMALHLLIVASEAWFVFIFGLLAWTGLSGHCQDILTRSKTNGKLDKDPAYGATDLWILFQVTVVLISAVFVSCGVCALCGMIAHARSQGGGGGGGGGGAAAGEEESFIEQNPTNSGGPSDEPVA